MAIDVCCPSCGLKTSVPDSAQGSRGLCPRCKGPVQVPSLELKRCTNCRQDLAGKKRVKDAKGRYYCATCYAALSVPRKSDIVGTEPTWKTGAGSPVDAQAELSEIIGLLPEDTPPPRANIPAASKISRPEADHRGKAETDQDGEGSAKPQSEEFCSRCGASNAVSPLVNHGGSVVCLRCVNFLNGRAGKGVVTSGKGARLATGAFSRNNLSRGREGQSGDANALPEWWTTVLTIVGCWAALVGLHILQWVIGALESPPQSHPWQTSLNFIAGYVGLSGAGNLLAALLLVFFLKLLRPLSPNANCGSFDAMLIKATGMWIAVVVAALLISLIVLHLPHPTGLVGGGIVLLAVLGVPAVICFGGVKILFETNFLTTLLSLMLEITALAAVGVVLVAGLGFSLLAILHGVPKGGHGRSRRALAMGSAFQPQPLPPAVKPPRFVPPPRWMAPVPKRPLWNVQIKPSMVHGAFRRHLAVTLGANFSGVAFPSPAGRYCAYLRHGQGHEFWQRISLTTTGTAARSGDCDGAGDGVCSPHGRYVADMATQWVAGRPHACLQVWSFRTGRLVLVQPALPLGTEPIVGFTDHHGLLVVTRDHDGFSTVSRIRLGGGATSVSWRLAWNAPRAISSDGRYLATVVNGCLKVWRTRTGRLRGRVFLKRHGNWQSAFPLATAVGFSAGGNYFGARFSDGRLGLWDMHTGHLVATTAGVTGVAGLSVPFGCIPGGGGWFIGRRLVSARSGRVYGTFGDAAAANRSNLSGPEGCFMPDSRQMIFVTQSGIGPVHAVMLMLGP